MTIRANASFSFTHIIIFDVEKKKKIKNLSDEKQQISYLFIYRIKQLQSNTIYHYSNQKIDCIDSVRRMMTIRVNTPLFITMKNKIKPKKNNENYYHIPIILINPIIK